MAAWPDRSDETNLSHYFCCSARGKGKGDISGFVDSIERVTHLLHQFPQIRELDINPVRVLADGSGVVALDARLRIEA